MGTSSETAYKSCAVAAAPSREAQTILAN